MIDSNDYVDLGLPSDLLWAKCNIGASTPEEAGLYFAWGDPTGYAAGSGHSFSEANYNATVVNGTYIKDIATDITPTSGFDAARENLGGKWRMPTLMEAHELDDNTNHVWTTINGVNGFKFISKTDSNKWIFLPAFSHFEGMSLYNNNNSAYEILLTGLADNANSATRLIGNPTGLLWVYYTIKRYYGLPIRPVRDR